MKGDKRMNWNRLKKGVAGMAIIITLLFSIGAGLQTTAQAQDRGRDNNWRRDHDGGRDRDGWRDRDRNRDRDRDWYRRQQIQRARELELRRQREIARSRAYRYGTYRNYPYYGNSGGYYGGSGYNSELQRGYRNGLKEGADDARDRDSFNPSRHSSFRDGNPAYRDGFGRGYQEGYRQYAGYRRW